LATRPERVLLVHDYGGRRGGAELIIHDLRSMLRARGIDARLLASTADRTDPGDEADYWFRGSTGLWRSLRETANPDAARMIRRVMADFDPQVIHLGMFLTQASPAVLPVIRGRAVVWTAHEYRAICPKGTRLLPDGTACQDAPGRACLRSGCFRLRGWAPRMVQLALFERGRDAIRRIISPSRAVAAVLESHGIPVDAVIPHGVPLGPESPAPPAGQLLGFVGRLLVEKGAAVLLDAMALLPSRFGAVRLWIAGDGPERPALTAQAARLGLAGRVDFLGHLPRAAVGDRFREVAVQVVPSIWTEPFGLVTAEAMARGTPVVASAVGGARELLQDGVTGFLVPPANPRALAGRLAEILDHPELRRSVAVEARCKAVAELGLELMTDRLMAVYQEVIAVGEGGAP
jgi:glycosyltransferase involved in cell wall biosynthesis